MLPVANTNIHDLNNTSSFDCKDRLKKFWGSLPLFIKFVISSTLILYIINWIIPIIGFYLADIPYYTIKKFQFWRLVTNVFLTTSLLNIIFALLSWVRDATSLEIAMGTIKYMLVFLINSVLIQVLYCGILGLLSLILNNSSLLLSKMSSNYSVSSAGLWPLVLCEVTLLCLSNPNSKMMLLFCPFRIKAIYYPFLLLGIYFLLNGGLDIEALAAIGYGFAYQYLLKKKLQISDDFVRNLESKAYLRWMMKLEGFVSVNQIGSHPSFSSQNNTIQSNNNNDYSNNNDTTNNNFKPFSGNGIAVGSNEGTIEYDSVAQTSSPNTSNRLSIDTTSDEGSK